MSEVTKDDVAWVCEQVQVTLNNKSFKGMSQDEKERYVAAMVSIVLPGAVRIKGMSVLNGSWDYEGWVVEIAMVRDKFLVFLVD